MKLDFNLKDIKSTVFGIGRDQDNEQVFSLVAVDNHVQIALNEITEGTWNEMQSLCDEPLKYEPSEKYASCEYIYLPLDHELSEKIRDLHLARNLPMRTESLSNPDGIFCYFTQMIDNHGRYLTALRRASQFKGVLNRRLIRLTTDALKLVEDHVFKLDNDFDLLVDSKYVHILRPAGFESTCKLNDAILAAVPRNIQDIQSDMPFLDLENIEHYAIGHIRAARNLASIRSQKEMKNIDQNSLLMLCRGTGVEIKEENGKLVVNDGQIMGFLEVLDRRRYELELINGSPECYKTASRQKINH